jgi:hypothetical protein
MPQVSEKFGPIYANVTLDGSGNGQVSFQAQGANVRITNLFVRVSTQTNQALCRMYKNQVSDSTNISSTNSGSTGAAAHGAIDLFDGENVIVRWTGGDASAIATATFVGYKLPFNERPTSEELTWDDPIAAGDGSLIYPAIKSPNYVAGVSGWRIAKNGSVEFNDATIRGSVSAGGGNVLLNASGLHIQGASTQYDINSSAGFLARNTPDDGTASQITPGGIFLTPEDPSPLGNGVDFAEIFVGYDNSGAANEAPFLAIGGVEYTGKSAPQIKLAGQAANDANPDGTSEISFIANSFSLGSTKFSRPNITYSFSKSIPSGAVTQIDNASFTVIQDSYPGLYNNGLFIPDRDGVWEFSVHARWQSQAAVTGQRQIRYQVNGVDIDYTSLSPTTALNSTLVSIELNWTDAYTGGDQIGFQAFQNSGGALTIGNAAKVSMKLIEG